jgi:hypothetical protein
MKCVQVSLVLSMFVLAVACAKTKRGPEAAPGGGGDSSGQVGEGGQGDQGDQGGGTPPNGAAGTTPALDGVAGCANEEPLNQPTAGAKRCDPCPQSLIWRVANGGVLGSELNCASYRFQDAPCALELSCESETEGEISVADIVAALRDPDVNQGRQTYGRVEDQFTDPIVWQIWNDGGPILVGAPCDGFEDCVDAPPGVVTLLGLLRALDAQKAYTSADYCTEQCPAAFDAALVGQACATEGLVCSSLPGCNGAPQPGLACENEIWTLRAPR